MTAMWGIHNDKPDLDFVERGLIAIGWDKFGDIRAVGSSRPKIKNRLLELEPDAKAGAIPVWAGVLFRFAFEMRPGDTVVYPDPWARTINLGTITGDYTFEADAPASRSRRTVDWKVTGLPREQLSQGALFELGSALTLFSVRNHAAEVGALTESAAPPSPAPKHENDTDVELATQKAEEAITAQRIEESTRDFIISILLGGLSPTQFEQFVAAVLRAHGYRAEVTPPSGDWGVDVVAYRDPLGVEDPRIKVQCKQTASTMGGPDVARLVGALAGGGSEVGLFVSLGTFSKDAVVMERQHHNLKLVDGPALVQLLLDGYDSLAMEWKQLLPLKQVWVSDSLSALP
jgi:restriction system protein